MIRKSHFSTYILIAINVWFGILVAKYAWNTALLSGWGAMSGKMPTSQALAQFPPFATMEPAQMMKLPAFLLQPINGGLLILVRALYASFLHFSWAHLGSNMLVLFMIGRTFEDTNYSGLLIPVYCVTGITSMTAAYLIQPLALTAGASGALFGIMGAMWMMSFRAKRKVKRGDIDDASAQNYARAGQYVYGLIVLNLISTFLVPGISIVGHVAGLISGLLLGMIMPLKHW